MMEKKATGMRDGANETQLAVGEEGKKKSETFCLFFQEMPS